eukprot:CAMPEP_0175142432 /NCGR_PEP_ID=MMETSP0087-20121206/12801_1 /TAXON_ID=136419 /ORGANISM="Unknown Unknown, Strain D1" /LENGTH=50 /DNA_ID=CAMNT_0016426245 /DNA_START=432 /DNA_END=584 /DNA_ORIENTATION=-
MVSPLVELKHVARGRELDFNSSVHLASRYSVDRSLLNPGSFTALFASVAQ